MVQVQSLTLSLCVQLRQRVNGKLVNIERFAAWVMRMLLIQRKYLLSQSNTRIGHAGVCVPHMLRPAAFDPIPDRRQRISSHETLQNHHRPVPWQLPCKCACRQLQTRSHHCSTNIQRDQRAPVQEAHQKRQWVAAVAAGRGSCRPSCAGCTQIAQVANLQEWGRHTWLLACLSGRPGFSRHTGQSHK